MSPRIPSSTQIELYRNSGARRITGLAVLAIACAGAVASPGADASDRPSRNGGAVFVAQPKIAKVTCLRGCATRRRAQGGATLRITGSDLEDVTEVTFHGSAGSGDDLPAKVRSGSRRRVHAVVPYGAVTGPLSAEAPGGRRSARTKPVSILPAPPPEPNARLSPVPGPRQKGAPTLETGTSRTKAFFGSRRTVTFSYRISQGSPSSVEVELVRARDGSVVRKWSPTGRRGHRRERDLERGGGPQARRSGALLVPADRGRRRGRARLELRGRRREPGLLRPLRPRLPRPRDATTTAARVPASARAAPATATRVTTSSPAAARRWSRPAAAACSSAATTARRATTW